MSLWPHALAGLEEDRIVFKVSVSKTFQREMT